jgi:methionyl-tRNA formyltransferase
VSDSSSSRPRALFFGTPEFAVPCLSVVAELCDVALVITQPDRPSGRGMKLAPPPVKVRANELGFEVIQPTKVRTPEFALQLRDAGADLAVVVAYGRILTPEVLAAPRLGCVNVHASLLPKYRGAAPIQWAIVCGEHETGVCLMQMDSGLDTGPELARATIAIGPDETAGELSERLSKLGAELLRRELPRFVAGMLTPVPQPQGATLAPILKKEDGALDFTQPARALHDRVRGLSPWPGAYAFLETGSARERVKIHRTRVHVAAAAAGEAGRSNPAADTTAGALCPGIGHARVELAEPRTGTGTPTVANENISAGRLLGTHAEAVLVACGEGVLAITELQFEGGKRLPAATALAGRRLPPQARFAKPDA